MTLWQGIVLGVVQGLTEFLPISSSGHLVVAQRAVGLAVPGVLVEVTLHLATLLAVLLVYWDRILELASGALRGDKPAWKYVALLAVGSIPAGVVGVLFKDWFEQAFDSLLVVGICFCATAAILWSTRWARAGSSRSQPTVRGGFAIGCAQALAVLPGISRSGTTISAGMWLGVDPVRAAEFSFLLAVPAIGGAAVLQVPDVVGGAIHGIGWGSLMAGFVAALLSGIFAIRWLVRLLGRGTFHRFGPYCLTLGVLTICWALVG
jgi:undecaprenyl-diphosphatase